MNGPKKFTSSHLWKTLDSMERVDFMAETASLWDWQEDTVTEWKMSCMHFG